MIGFTMSGQVGQVCPNLLSYARVRASLARSALPALRHHQRPWGPCRPAPRLGATQTPDCTHRNQNQYLARVRFGVLASIESRGV
jgi:hypothetical protein